MSDITEELVAQITAAVETAIQSGYHLISGDYGVKWDGDSSRWVWDSTVTRTACCCPIGAYLLINQPDVDPADHRGDAHQAALLALDCDRFELKDFLNGFDGHPLNPHTETPEAYWAGFGLKRTYRPLDVDILALQVDPPSGIRLNAALIPPSKPSLDEDDDPDAPDYESDDEDDEDEDDFESDDEDAEFDKEFDVAS